MAQRVAGFLYIALCFGRGETKPLGVQWVRLQKLAARLELFDAPSEELPSAIALPEKDAPIIFATMQLAAKLAQATYLPTGDVRHFGAYLGKKVAGVLIVLPGDYLRNRVEGRR